MGYRRSVERNHRLKRIYDSTKHKYTGGVYFDEEKNRYIRYCPRNTTGYTKFIRRKSNKRFRKQNEPLNHNQYRKVYDYWWTLI